MPYLAYLASSGIEVCEDGALRFPLTYTFTLPGDLPPTTNFPSLDPDSLAYTVCGNLRLYNSICEHYNIKFAASSVNTVVTGTNFTRDLNYEVSLLDVNSSQTTDFSFALTRLGDDLQLDVTTSNSVFSIREQFAGGATTENNDWWRFNCFGDEGASPWNSTSIDAASFPVAGTINDITYSSPSNTQVPNNISGSVWGYSSDSPDNILFSRYFNPYQGV